MQALPLRNVPFPFDVSLPWASNQEKFFVIPYASCYKGFFSLLSRISRIQLCILSVIHCAPLLSGEKILSRHFTPAPLQVIFCYVHLYILCYQCSCGGPHGWNVLMKSLFQAKVCESFIPPVLKSLPFPSLVLVFFPCYYSNTYWLLGKQ